MKFMDGQTKLDHMIVKVNDFKMSIDFYTRILGFQEEGMDGPFAVLRVNREFQMQLCQAPTKGMEHYAFAVSRSEFDRIFERLKSEGIGYGPTFNSVGSNAGPGEETGARGLAPTLYFNDPNLHLLEIRTYEAKPDSI